jgi:peptidoglycan-associated lipoprotein
MTSQRVIALTVTLCVTVMAAGCQKHESHSSAAPKSSPPSSAPADQSASIWVDPDSIPAGGSAALTWRTTNATDVSIDGIGAVQRTGSVSVSPRGSTTYHLTAKGPGGTLDVTTQLTVRGLSHSITSSGREFHNRRPKKRFAQIQ